MNSTLSSAFKRGRPSAANDNTEHNAAALAARASAVKSLKDQGLTFREIADRLSISPASVNNAIHGRPPARKYPAANDNKIVRLVANNGGCSTTSGMVPVSLPRVATLERAAA